MKDTKQVCHYCEEATNNPTKDHIIPISKIRKAREKGEEIEGYDQHNNKVWACRWCNQNKRDLDYDSFKALGLSKIRHLKKLAQMTFNQNRKRKRVLRRYRK